MKKLGVPQKLLILYISFYAGQSFYGTYLNLYLSEIGLSKSMIGIIVSVSTMFLLLAQPAWGYASDKVKKKNTILKILLLGSTLTALLFYFSTSFWYIFCLITVFAIFFTPITPLLDNLSLESMEVVKPEENKKKKWDYGRIRMGGTIGYCVASFLSGMVLKNNYSHIFWIISIFMIGCFLLIFTLPTVKGYPKKKEKAAFKQLLHNRSLICLIFIYVVFSIGLNFFYSYYPIYYISIGGNSSFVGIMMTVCSITEIPCLFLAGRVVKRYGTVNVMIVSGLITTLRWFLLFAVTNPVLAILVNMLHGLGFVGFTYCIILYINDNVPKELRATSQSLNVLISTFFSRILFGYLGGLGSDFFGVNYMLLGSCIMTLTATIIFAFWHRHIVNTEPGTL
jgi:MFS transporter, PPP family, 3-phenylpropionic acid transporter